MILYQAWMTDHRWEGGPGTLPSSHAQGLTNQRWKGGPEALPCMVRFTIDAREALGLYQACTLEV